MQIRTIRLNNLIFNPNRDPEFYRRGPGETFRVQADVHGVGRAHALLEVGGETLCESDLELPGTFDCRFQFDTAGTRVARLEVRQGDAVEERLLRLDVVTHDWVE